MQRESISEWPVLQHVLYLDINGGKLPPILSSLFSLISQITVQRFQSYSAEISELTASRYKNYGSTASQYKDSDNRIVI